MVNIFTYRPERVNEQNKIQTTGLPIFQVFEGILLKRPGMVKNENEVIYLLFYLLFYPN